MPHAPIFVGSAAAVTTPFREDGSLDLYSFDRILDFILERNTDAVVVCGTTGEFVNLTLEERKSSDRRGKNGAHCALYQKSQ